MPTPIVGDFVAGPIIMIFGVIAGLVAFVPIVVIEATMLWLLKWGSFWRSLRDSATANLASMLLGLVFALIFLSSQWYTWSPLLLFGLSCVLSIMIEGWMLGYLSRYEPRRTWTAAVMINLVSYVFLEGFVALGYLRPWI